MTLKRLVLATLFIMAAAAVPAAAQVLGTNSPSAPPIRQPPPYIPPSISPRGTFSPDGPYASTHSVSGEVWRVNASHGYVDVFVPKRGMGRFYVSEKTRLRADKETPLGGKKPLALEDFQEGQTVTVTFWPRSLAATELRARRPKK